MTRRATLQYFALVSLAAAIGFAQEVDTLVSDAPLSDALVSDAPASDAPTPDPSETRRAPAAERRGADPNDLGHTAGGGGLRLREGVKLVNQIGELRYHGDGVAFYPDGETHSLQLLENLALERVSHDLDQSHRKWSVTGVVTEYKGSNFLLLQRAVLKARPSTTSGPRS
jgi:hypothetical protein